MASPNPHDSPFLFVAHPPERGRSRSSVPVCAGACCTCCCCLHSIGGLLGAAIGSVRLSNNPETDRIREEDNSDDFIPSANESTLSQSDEGKSRARSAVVIFWNTTYVLIFLGILICAVVNNNLVGTTIIMLTGFPLLQILAIGITFLILLVQFRQKNFGVELWRLGRIALGTTVGTVAGIGAMLVLRSMILR
jgi:hypothetical protein